MASNALTIGEYRNLWTEAQFEQAVQNLAKANGWLIAHPRKVRIQRSSGEVYWETPMMGDGRGFPDWVFARDGVVVMAELKSAKGAVKREQEKWLKACGGYLWRPKDWDTITEVLR